MEKIAINIVGVGHSSDDVSTQLLNFSGGFRAVTGKIVSRDADSLYLGITSDRAYIVTVEGDLSLSTETSDCFDSKIAGVTGFDIDWTLTAKQFGNGSGKIIVTNPDAPSEVSTFEVFMGEPRSIVVDIAANSGCLVLDICEDAWPPLVLVGSRNFSPRGDLDGVKVNSPDVVAAFVRSFEAMIGSNNNGRSDVSNDDVVIIGSSNLSQVLAHELEHDFRPRPKGTDPRVDQYSAFMDRPDHNPFVSHTKPVLVFGDFNDGGHEHYHRPEDFCTRAPSVECALVDAQLGGLGLKPKAIGVGTDLTQPTDHSALVFKLSDLGEPFGLARGPVLVRATIEDLMASYGNDGDGDATIEIKQDVRDFDQLARTRAHDLRQIETAVALANFLSIDTSNVASRRDAAQAKLEVFADRFEMGGSQPVTEEEARVLHEAMGELWDTHADLNQLVSHWHHYKGHEANHDAWEQRLANRKRNFKVADDAGDNRIATSYVTYAASPEETLAASKAAFVELFQAIQKGDRRAAHQADTRARQFSTREHLLDALVRRGKLVVVEEVSATA